MNRAAVIIAVKKAGPLTELQAAHSGAKLMKEWAEAHGFDPVISITDETAPVTADLIKKAIKELVDASAYEQLFIYFAGHGVNLRYSEYWLLSDAPEDTQAAVNVASSVQLAKRCGIPHVVFISDACRTAPEGIQAQSITGSEIFPNRAAMGPMKAVDVFYASLLGEPAKEIREPGDSSSIYRSLYTDELLAALRGERTLLLEQPEPPQGLKFLRSHKLKRHLTLEVPRLVREKLGSLASETQQPDAEVQSDPEAYLQDFDPAVLPVPDEDSVVRSGELVVPPLTPAQRSLELVRGALRADVGQLRTNVTMSLRRPDFRNVRAISEAALDRETLGFGPLHFETNCGFKVQGAAIKAIHAGRLQVERLPEEAVGVDLDFQPMANVMLELEDGRAVVLPAIRDFIGALTFEGDDLINISYEPSDRGPLWHEYVKVRDEITALRATISSSVHMGVFRLKPEEAPQLTERIRYMKGLDPTLAIYAAYSYHRMGNSLLIQKMGRYLVEGFGASLFDVVMLSGDPNRPHRIHPFFPMLAQGWALLGAFDALTPQLEALRSHVATDSLWTVFKPSAVPILLNSFQS